MNFPERLSNKEMRIFRMEMKLASNDYEIREKIRILSDYVLCEPWKCGSGTAFLGERECVVYRKLWWGLRGWERHMIVKDEIMLRILHREPDHRIISEDELGSQYKLKGRLGYWTRPHREQYRAYWNEKSFGARGYRRRWGL